MKQEKTILYLRMDIIHKPLIAGGSVSHTLGVLNGLKACNYTIVCATSVMYEQLVQLGIAPVHQLKNPKIYEPLRWRLNCLLSNIFFTRTILALCKNYSFDYVYQRYSILNCVGVLVSHIKKIPLILEYNGSEVWLEQHWAPKKTCKLLWLVRRLELFNLRKAHTIVVVSQPLHDELVARGISAHKILVNPNGVDTQRFDPALLVECRSDVRTELHINNKRVFGFVGTFSVWHGIELLAQMVPRVIGKESNVHFLFIGDGPLLDFLKDELGRSSCLQYVTFTGIVPSDVARRYLAACDVFLAPTQPNKDGSPFFGSPTKLFEYMSMAKPIIASRIGQVAELLAPSYTVQDLRRGVMHGDEQMGVLIEPDDVAGFVDAAVILALMSDQMLDQMGNNARTHAVNKHQWKNHVEKIDVFATRRG